MNTIGPTVRKIRRAKNLTQDQLVARCNLLEWNISRGTLAKIESQVRRITDIEVVMSIHVEQKVGGYVEPVYAIL